MLSDCCLGLEELIDPEEWDREKIFQHLKRYKCSNGTPAQQAAVTAEWEALHIWMRAHETSESLTVGAPVRLETGAEFNTTPAMSWQEAWAALPRIDDQRAQHPAESTEQRDGARLAAALTRMRGADREALAGGRTAAQ